MRREPLGQAQRSKQSGYCTRHSARHNLLTVRVIGQARRVHPDAHVVNVDVRAPVGHDVEVGRVDELQRVGGRRDDVGARMGGAAWWGDEGDAGLRLTDRTSSYGPRLATAHPAGPGSGGLTASAGRVSTAPISRALTCRSRISTPAVFIKLQNVSGRTVLLALQQRQHGGQRRRHLRHRLHSAERASEERTRPSVTHRC